jgi:type II secretory pathway component GspD/PulD (secretin)
MPAAVQTEPAAGTPQPEPAARPGQPENQARPSGQEGSPQESSEGKPSGGSEESAGKPANGSDPQRETPPAVRVRPGEPKQPPNRDELLVRPEEDGRIQFSFQGQAWPDVLEWFASISQRTLDWQELPGDYLNLTVRRRYTLDEARDLLNRHLLARGFTLLEHGEGFSVVKIENINPAMVPRIAAEELEDHFPHEFVRVLFELDWLLADELVQELEALKSPHGRLVAMSQTNRLEAMDAVANLRDLDRLLKITQSRSGRQRLVREFSLVHVRASELQRQLEDFLGIERKERGPSGPMTPQEMAQMQQQAQMQAQMKAQQQQQGGAGAQAKPKTPDLRLTSDNRRNALLVHAPPDKMAIVESFIELVDVPTGRADSLDAYLNRMKVYRLASLDPEQFVKSLEELGGLQPTTTVRADSKNHAVLVDASLVDHYTIKSLIEKLDGSGRRFEVVTLRKHAADEVAGSIEFLMGANEKEQPSRTPSYYGYSPYGMSMNTGNDSSRRDKFRVGANVESNQLLLWANEIELQEVDELLMKLGERPARRGSNHVRTLEMPLGRQAEEFLRELERAWPGMAPNPLLLPRGTGPSDIDPTTSPPVDSPGSEAALPAESERRPEPIHDVRGRSETERIPEQIAEHIPDNSEENIQESTRWVRVNPQEQEEDLEDIPSSNPFRSAQHSLQPDRRDTPPDRRDAPPVRLGIGPDGNLVISSEDLAALDLLEQWLLSRATPSRPYEIFRIRHASAYWVKLNLEDYFKEDKPDRSGDVFNSWYWGLPQPSREQEKRQLGKRRPLRFIHDYDTNTILVQGADRGQLEIISELIELYDVPEPVTSQSMRVTKLFQIKHSRAEVIAETIKDAYRDLLSSNDKALQAQQQEQGQRTSATIIRSYGPSVPGSEEEPDRKTQITFKGKLSLGVDEITNTLLVSAEGDSLMNTIGQVIEALDQAAKEESHIEVRELSSRMNGDTLGKTLAKILEQQRREASNGQPPAPQPPTSAQPPVIVSGF